VVMNKIILNHIGEPRIFLWGDGDPEAIHNLCLSIETML